jgi:hypothetical protein
MAKDEQEPVGGYTGMSVPVNNPLLDAGHDLQKVALGVYP